MTISRKKKLREKSVQLQRCNKQVALDKFPSYNIIFNSRKGMDLNLKNNLWIRLSDNMGAKNCKITAPKNKNSQNYLKREFSYCLPRFSMELVKYL